MQLIALLRGVMPSGKNSIPKMSYLASVLSDNDFSNVKTYIQSGNIILETNLSHSETKKKIHNIILKYIGADLSVIIKTKTQLLTAVNENPFDNSYDFSRIHLLFTNDNIDLNKLKSVENTDFGDEIFKIGTECLYMYLPKNASKKKLNNNYIEKKLGIVATTRKLSVVKHLYYI